MTNVETAIEALRVAEASLFKASNAVPDIRLELDRIRENIQYRKKVLEMQKGQPENQTHGGTVKHHVIRFSAPDGEKVIVGFARTRSEALEMFHTATQECPNLKHDIQPAA